MKIVIVTSSFPNSENSISGNFILDQINNIQAFYKNVKFFVCAPGNSLTSIKKKSNIRFYNFRYFFPRKYEKIGIESITDLIKKNKIYYFVIFFYTISQFLKLIFIVSKEKPDLIYAHWFTPQAITSFIVSKLFNIPYKITIHSSDLKILDYYLGRIGRNISKIILKSSSGITVTSKNIFKTVEIVLNKSEISDLNILQHPMGIDSIGLEQTNKDLDILKLLDPKSKYILYLGRLVEKKGLESLINGFAEFSKNSDYKLIIAGFGNLEAKMKKLVNKKKLHDKVIFTGKVGLPKKKALFENSEMLIVPSDSISGLPVSEGMPVTILEGLYFGKLVVASSQTNCEDIIENGVNGFVFEATGSESIVEILDKVSRLDSKEKNTIRTNALKSSSLYDSKGSSKMYYEFLKND